MKTTTSIKLDTKVKKEASELAEQLGLSLSSVINATLKKFVTERRVVFSVAPEFNEKTRKELLSLRADVKNRKDIVGPFDNAQDLKKSLKG